MVHGVAQVLDPPTGRDSAKLRETVVPVTVIASYSLLPGCIDIWLAAWKEIARLARSRPCCLAIRLLRDRRDAHQCYVVSTWDDLQSFHQFVRDIGLVWIERNALYSRIPATFTHGVSSSPVALGDLVPLEE